MGDRSSIHLSQGRALVLGKRTLVAGALNTTPDSFYDGSRFFHDLDKAIARIGAMLKDGADIIDIGGESTRPGSTPISADEELERVIPTIRRMRERYGPEPILSVDTYKSAVAREVIAAGADMINSLGGSLLDPDMAAVIAESGCPMLIYHIRGNPRTMQEGEIIYQDIVADIRHFFEEQIALLVRKGGKKEQCIIDPGIGFGKSVGQNLEILRRLDELQALDLPVMIGVSRKSHLASVLKDALGLADLPPPQERLEASLAETAVAVLHGADLVRTHDVWETRKFLALIDAIYKSPEQD